MAESTPAGSPARSAGDRIAQGSSAGTVYWRYLIFWLLFFGLLYFVSLFGIVAEA